jgi:hydrogenase maturation protease
MQAPEPFGQSSLCSQKSGVNLWEVGEGNLVPIFPGSCGQLPRQKRHTTVFDSTDIPRRKPLTIIGLGNELLSDDGVGIRIVRALKQRLPSDGIAFEELSIGGLQLLDYITDCEQCIIVDAVTSGKHPAGTTYRFIQTSDSNPVSLTSSHQIDLAQVLTLASVMGGRVPRTVVVYGVEAGDSTTFHDGCTREVSRAIPKVVDAICRDVEGRADTMENHAGEWQIINDDVLV